MNELMSAKRLLFGVGWDTTNWIADEVDVQNIIKTALQIEDEANQIKGVKNG